MEINMTTREMSEAEFSEYINTAIKEYAEDITNAGRVSGDKAIEESTRTFDAMAPKNGKNTEKNCLYIIEAEGNKIGIFWYVINDILEETVAFIADIRIEKAMRNKGYGRKILNLFDKEVKEKGYKVVGLNVFKDNTAAIHLYESDGYEVAADGGGSFYMKKYI